MVGRVADVVVLSGEERRFLETSDSPPQSATERHRAPRSLLDRCRMILLCAEGFPSKEVAARLGVHEHTVGKWRRRFAGKRIEGLTDEYRPGRPRTVTDEQVAEVIERTLNTIPKDATHWSIRSMAAQAGLSHPTIWRIWNAFGLQPHGAETFKLSADPLFGTGTALSVWISLIAQRADDPELDVRRLIALVGAHWRRGLGHLDKDWEQANQDVARFVKRLVEVAKIPNFWARPATSGGTETGVTFSSDQI